MTVLPHKDSALTSNNNLSANTVLIAEDDPLSRHLLKNWLEKWKYRVIAFENGADAWLALQRDDCPQMVILDWVMPGIDGVELCRRIRGQQGSSYKYVLLLTAQGDKDDVVEGLDAGADDYLTKPFNVKELRARVRAGQRILELQNALQQAHTELKFESAHDHLTGLWNRRAILDLLHRETRRSKRMDQPFGVIMADLDHFKQINDTHGHLVGDTVLREVAHRLLLSVRDYDYVGRYGGEEFLIVLTECEFSDLMVTAERMRTYVSERPIETDVGPLVMTVSIGLQAHSVSGLALPVDEELVRAADRALYRAKAKGGNCIEEAAESITFRA